VYRCTHRDAREAQLVAALNAALDRERGEKESFEKEMVDAVEREQALTREVERREWELARGLEHISQREQAAATSEVGRRDAEEFESRGLSSTTFENHLKFSNIGFKMCLVLSKCSIKTSCMKLVTTPRRSERRKQRGCGSAKPSSRASSPGCERRCDIRGTG
jgi:hypothetical protein